MRGIDVSHHQGKIDWAKVERDGVEFAVLRVGNHLSSDREFLNNVKGCVQNGIPYGVYHYSTALTEEQAISEAVFVADLLKRSEEYGRPKYPVYFDWEDEACLACLKADPVKIRLISIQFCRFMELKGFHAGIYTNRSMYSYFYPANTPHMFTAWIAAWGVGLDDLRPYHFDMWQHTNIGRVNGINGDVDINEAFVDFATLIGG